MHAAVLSVCPFVWQNLCLRFRIGQSSTHPQSSVLN